MRKKRKKLSNVLKKEEAHRSWLFKLKLAIDFRTIFVNEKSRPPLYASSSMVAGNDSIPTHPPLLPPTRDPLKKSVEDR